MRNLVLIFLFACCFNEYAFAQKVVIIRHAEKPLKGDNLNCQGLNRSLQLPAVLISKFGIPAYIFVPSLGLDTSTRHARMFETVIPLAAKYNLVINSKYAERDSAGLASEIKIKEGTVLVVWEHGILPSIVRSLGVNNFHLTWSDNDYDSIWIVTFSKGVASLTMDKEALAPSSVCPN